MMGFALSRFSSSSFARRSDICFLNIGFDSIAFIFDASNPGGRPGNAENERDGADDRDALDDTVLDASDADVLRHAADSVDDKRDDFGADDLIQQLLNDDDGSVNAGLLIR